MSEGNRHDEIQGKILHVYDGIEEADNELPLWWLWTFYGALIFGVGYWFYFHELELGELPSYEVAAATAEVEEVPDEVIATMAQDPATVAAGRETFATLCVSCHGERAEGNNGPNLTDAYWIHGGNPSAIHATIRDGVASGGMPPWGPSLGPMGVLQAAAYIVSLRDTNVEGRAPQGVEWGPGGTPPAEGADGADGADGAEEADGAAEGDGAEPADGADADAEGGAAEPEAADDGAEEAAAGDAADEEDTPAAP